MQQVQAFIDAHGESRFTPLEGDQKKAGPRTINRAGWSRVTVDAISGRTTTDYYLTATAFKEIVNGFDAKWAANMLVCQGVIAPGKEGKTAKIIRIPGEGALRVYHLPHRKEPTEDETE